MLAVLALICLFAVIGIAWALHDDATMPRKR
jgi:hypothetical protein